jgi:hypothetical protein
MSEDFKNLVRIRLLPFVIIEGVIARSLELAQSARIWIGVLIAVVALFGGLSALLWFQGAQTASFWVLVTLAALATYWALIALYAWSEIGWVRRLNAILIVTGGFGVLIALLKAAGLDTPAHAMTTIYLSVVGFMIGVNVLRVLLMPSHPILGVARTMLEEALRLRIAVVIIAFYLVMLSTMPLVLGSEDRVTYMAQRFLVYSHAMVYVVLGLLTVLLGAYSISKELSTRQAHMTLTKPLARWQYLLGKWLGIVLLDAVLVAVAGVAIYGFTMSIARNPALNDLDRYAVDREVLTARLALNPDPINATWEQMYINVLEENQRLDPEKYGEVGDPIGSLPDDAKQEIVAEAVGGFYTVDGGSSKQYKFEGLADAVAASEASIARGRAILREQAGLSEQQAEQYVRYVLGRPNELKDETAQQVSMQVYDELVRELEREKITLVLTPDTSPEPEDQIVEITMKLNNQPWPRPVSPGAPTPRQKLVLETPNDVTIPAHLISPDGTLVITIEVPENRNDGVEQAYIQFNYKDAQIDLYYRVGSFEANLAKAMLVVWLKLVFLAMLGLAAGALMSFPVAAMVGLVVFVAASASGVIDEALSNYASTPKNAGAWGVVTTTVGSFFTKLGEGEVYDALRIVIRLIGESFMLLIPKFGAFATSDDLSTGRAIDGGLVLGALLKIGVMWTGIVALIGWGFFGRKEIARVTV